MGDLEDGVHLDVLAGQQGLTALGVDGELRGVDHLERVAGHVEDVGPGVGTGGGHDALSSIQGTLVLVVGLGVGRLGTRRLATAARGTSREHTVVPGVVVVDACRLRVTTSGLADHPGKRIRGERRPRVRVVDAVSTRPGQVRAWMVLHVQRQVGLVHPVDRQQQYVGDTRGSLAVG
jgi:hypothetical protein